MAEEDAIGAGDEDSTPAPLKGIDQPDQEPSSPLENHRKRKWPLSLSELSPLQMALVVGLASFVAVGTLCSWLGYRAHQAREEDQFRALLIQIGKQAAVNLTTIDYEHAERDVQRILDSATGEFREDFKNRSGPFIDIVKKVQSKSVGTVTEAGLESMNPQEGRVLLAVTVKSSSRGSPDEKPRYWRMRVTVGREGDEAKVSRVDFIP